MTAIVASGLDEVERLAGATGSTTGTHDGRRCMTEGRGCLALHTQMGASGASRPARTLEHPYSLRQMRTFAA